MFCCVCVKLWSAAINGSRLTLGCLASIHDLLELSVGLALADHQVLLLGVEVHCLGLLADLLRVRQEVRGLVVALAPPLALALLLYDLLLVQVQR